ncbi:winged helix-turn-helix domain-containing protein [Streptomyces sp. PCS3-D2]|uniref:GntR family transcriptional regulator n=1 Tax=Streptomyces sp. PCS3-D2 TaxID=1460244 RepID=UPI00044FF470|nr:winged helix-turn-helix domain-containing protein [Streptomyces sp. PCS3-D2]WKV73884.1 winged helix-turn-helix domain-containing protein [Streptomyces sp. PCS3-D2]
MPEASPRGTYLLIADALRKEIEEGHPKNSTLPSEAALMQAHDVSRNTVRRALKTLESEKLITSVPGAGWRVSRVPVPPLVERLTAVITEDHLAVGDKYPSEANLCERFGMSRTAVRHALAQMEGIGLLATVHGKGRTVLALPTTQEES